MSASKPAKRREGPRITQIRALMADGKPRSAVQMADELRISAQVVHTYLRAASKPGPLQEVHSVDRKDRFTAERYVAGPGTNIRPRRKRGKADPDHALTDVELDEKHRSRMRWWPTSDHVVLRSINAMVRAGAQA